MRDFRLDFSLFQLYPLTMFFYNNNILLLSLKKDKNLNVRNIYTYNFIKI